MHDRREEFHRKLRAAQLQEGFSYNDGSDFVTRPYWPLEPKNKMQPHLWKWAQVRELVMECGEMIGLSRGEKNYDRRVLALTNPGAGGDFTLSGPLFGDIQLIRTGESAPCHRHTPCATRFILEGTGGWTTIGGERVHVQPGDVVYTGQFLWHDHGNDGPDDFIFLDVLDIPLLLFTGTSAWEFDYESITGSKAEVNQPAMVTDFPNERYVQSHLRPTFKSSWQRQPADFAKLSYHDVQRSLRQLGEERGSRYDGIRLEMQNTAGGGPVGRTVSVHTQWLRRQEKTLAHRHTGASIFVCTEGHGQVNVGDRVLEFSPGDIFVIPSWHWHWFQSKKGCFLHSISDLALIRKMHLCREQRRDENGAITDSGWTDQAEPCEL